MPPVAQNDPKDWLNYREPISKVRESGNLVEWNGSYGWIQAHTQIMHPAAALHGGRLYVAADEVHGPPPDPGGEVSFFVYCDMNGLGAGDVRASGSSSSGAITTGGQTLRGAGPILSAYAKKNGLRYRVVQNRVQGKLIEWDGKEGWIEPLQPVESRDVDDAVRLVTVTEEDIHPPGARVKPGDVVSFFVFSENYTDPAGNKLYGAEKVMQYKGTQLGGETDDPKKKKEVRKDQFNKKMHEEFDETMSFMAPLFEMMGFDMDKGGKGKGKDWKKFMGIPKVDGSDRPRERITEVPVSGIVKQWKGHYGWVSPEIPIDHPKYKKNVLYCSKKDVKGRWDAPEDGMACTFHVYVDEAGLGAEECRIAPQPIGA